MVFQIKKRKKTIILLVRTVAPSIEGISWPTKPKIITTWPFIEIVLTLGLDCRVSTGV